MKKLFNVLVFWTLLLGASCAAQTTAVSATVVDLDGTTWANGSWSIQFVPNPSQPNIGAYNINGTPLSSSVLNQSGTLNGSGILAVSVYQQAPITPVGSAWKLIVCPNASTACGVYTFTAVGTSQNISSPLTSAIPAPRFQPVSGAYGYNDAEAILQLKPGSTYWNVTSNTLRCYDGTVWGSCSTGGGGGSGAIDSVANIAALRAYAGIAQQVNVVGYYTASLTGAPDGGGGIFVDQGAGASADDGGVIIYDSSIGHNWKRQIPVVGTIVDAWFGSKNDNSTNNAAAIQAGWDYMCAARAGRFQFQSGKIRFGSTLVKQCTFEVLGTGWNINSATYGTTLIYTGNVSPAISYHNNASIYTYAFDSLHDLGLAYAGSATTTWINAIEFGNPQDSLMLNGTIDHIAFDSFPGSGLRFTYTAPTTWAATFTGYISDGTGASPGNIMCVTAGTPNGNYLNGTSVPANTFIVGNVSAGVHPNPISCTGPGAGTAYYLNPETSLNITSETLRSNYGSGTYYQNLSITNIWDQGLGQLIGADNYHMNSVNVLTMRNIDHENAQSTAAGVAQAFIDLTAFQGKTIDRVIYEGATDSSPYLFALGQMDGYGSDISNIWIENGSMAHPMTGLADFIFQSYPGPYAKFSKLNLLASPAFSGATFNFSDYVMDARLAVEAGPYDFSEGPHSSNNLITATAGQGFRWSKNVISKVQACGSARAEAIVDPAVMQLCSTVPDVYVNEHGLFLPGFAKGPLSVTVTGAATQGIVSDAIQGRVFEANFSSADPNITFTVQPTADMVGSQITLGINWNFVTAQTAYGICPISSNYPFGVGQGITMTSGVGTGTLAGASCTLSDVPHNVWQTTFTTLNVLNTSPITYTFPRRIAGPAPSGTQTLRIASVYLGSGPQISYAMGGANALQPLTWLGTAAPSNGTYIVGDTVKNSVPASGVPSAWVNTIAGSPGTWKPLANIP